MDGKRLVAFSLTPFTFSIRQGVSTCFHKKCTSKPDKSSAKEDFKESSQSRPVLRHNHLHIGAGQLERTCFSPTVSLEIFFFFFFIKISKRGFVIFSMQNIILSALLIIFVLVRFLPCIQTNSQVPGGCSGCITKREKESFP